MKPLVSIIMNCKNGEKRIFLTISYVSEQYTDLNKKQAMDRSGGKISNKGADSAIAAIQLLKNC